MTSLGFFAGRGPLGREEDYITSPDEGILPTSHHHLGVAEAGCVATSFALPREISGGCRSFQ
jgi:hypothetical protein